MTQVPPRHGEGDRPRTRSGGGGGVPRPDATSAYRPEFEAALRLLARISEAMVARGLRRPILVGGAAAEFYSQSALTTGDFDLCTFRQIELEEEMRKQGVVRPSGAGRLLKGWIHPDLKLGFEVVA